MKKWRQFLLLTALCLLLGTAAQAAESDTVTVCVSMEKFTLGQGYVIEPTLVEVPDGTPASLVITQLLQEKWPDQEQPWQQTGTLTEAFYLSAVYDPARGQPVFPAYISKRASLTAVDQTPQWLGEFDYCSTSGWMYSVNDVFPNVGAADYPLEDGDVLRWQFTLYGYGSDLGADNSEWGAENITQVGSKDALTWEVALLNRCYSQTLCEENKAYQDALKILQDLEAGQTAIDGALAALRREGPRFADIPENAWYGEAVDTAVKSGLFQGTSEIQFSPAQTLNRAMAITVLYRMAGQPAVSGGSFADVPETVWYADAAAWGYAQGLMQDFAGEDMEPLREITRGEIAAMLYRWLGNGEAADMTVLDAFSDGKDLPDTYQEAMAWAVEQGIFQGDNEGKLSAEAQLTRCQFAAVTGRIAALVKR